MRALAAALVLRLMSGQLDGGREVDEVRAGSLDLVDGGHLDVDGGAYLPADSLLATGQELAQLRAQNAAFQSQAAPAPSVVAFVVVAVLAATLGAGVTLFAVKH